MARKRDNFPSDGVSSRDSTHPAVEATAAEWFALRDAGLSPEQERTLAGWLTADPQHAEAFAQCDAAWSAFGKPARSGDADQLLTELVSRRTRRRRTRLLAATAALMLAVLVATVALWRGGGAAQSLAVVHSPKQQRLSDGSTVTLRDGASIAVDFTASQRQIVLQHGEALFEVQKDRSRPFIVVANGIAVRAVGTAFSVHSAPGAVDVLVTEGVVSIGTAADGAAPANPPSVPERSGSAQISRSEPVTVTAGNRLLVEPASAARPSQPEAVLPAEIERRLSWRAPRVEFSGTPLAEAVALLNREAVGRTATRLRITDPKLNTERVSGAFRTDNLDAFLFLLETGFSIKVTRTGDSVALSKAP